MSIDWYELSERQKRIEELKLLEKIAQCSEEILVQLVAAKEKKS